MSKIACGLDTETTGFLDTGDHRLLEVYAGHWDLSTGKRIKTFYTKVHPQRSIPVDSFRVHGISLSDVEGCLPWEHHVDGFRDFLDEADVFVAHNAAFDLGFLNQENRRLGRSPIAMPVIDTMQAPWATANGKKPTLGELCFACGVAYDPSKAHAAEYDVERMMECLFNARRWGFFQVEI